MMAPLADQVKISIWPGVSTTIRCSGGSRSFSHSAITCACGSRFQRSKPNEFAELWAAACRGVAQRSCMLLTFAQRHQRAAGASDPILHKIRPQQPLSR